ncbi:LLM class flavin-dependent oxidoreductase [Streptantibioticus silvisoli]|uniref:LLM class flavin-dependent oxidoreductase n=1 Tax=Streptantibioticus silvisoli TaxID=2705255 RepID=A0ABT6W8B4_9ACTN|nr:LLM class flavin-dependent oxidoreductase [Streptantibioticus silvisoli]MDI5966529.1 LLM class flavin-dependent oxidoreductase [Streptantibioticus silvisoli]
MGANRRMLRLGAFLIAPGYHVASWRHPTAHADGGTDFAHYRDLVRTAERGKFDMVFLSDGLGIRTPYRDEEELSRWGRFAQFEPLSLLSALAVSTDRIGLAATASTSYNEPFHLARQFASLDFLSGGRAGWNVVTSVTDAEARNFNRDTQLDHETRYHRAREFMDVVTGLWDSWEDDAFLYDKESGRFFDPAKLHILHHKGEHFSVRGPLNVARPPQGYPVLVQAGASPDGQDFAAQWAEVVFTANQRLDQSQAFYRGMKEQVAAHGRDAEQIKIMPGVFPVIGRTRAEAEDKYAVLQELVDPVVGLGLLTQLLGDVDISGYPLDGPLPELPATEGCTSRQQLVWDKARREGLTIKELYRSVSGGRGHRIIIGTPGDVADELEEWFTAGGADGFNVMPPVLPDGLDDFVDLVIPELQRRQLFRTEYEGGTLRENLGLDRPAHRAASSAPAGH